MKKAYTRLERCGQHIIRRKRRTLIRAKFLKRKSYTKNILIRGQFGNGKFGIPSKAMLKTKIMSAMSKLTINFKSNLLKMMTKGDPVYAHYNVKCYPN